MGFMQRNETSRTDGELAVIRLLRHYGAMRDAADGDRQLSTIVALGGTLCISPEGSVALASVFQLTEAVLGRRLRTGCGKAQTLSGDERAVVRLLGTLLPARPGTGSPDIPHGMPGALAWAVLSVRRLCRGVIPAEPTTADGGGDGCPFAVDGGSGRP